MHVDKLHGNWLLEEHQMTWCTLITESERLERKNASVEVLLQSDWLVKEVCENAWDDLG